MLMLLPWPWAWDTCWRLGHTQSLINLVLLLILCPIACHTAGLSMQARPRDARGQISMPDICTTTSIRRQGAHLWLLFTPYLCLQGTLTRLSASAVPRPA